MQDKVYFSSINPPTSISVQEVMNGPGLHSGVNRPSSKSRGFCMKNLHSEVYSDRTHKENGKKK